MGEVVSLRWPSHNRILSEGLWNLFRENYRTDFELCARDEGGAFSLNENASLVIHRLIVAIFCPSIKDLTEAKLFLTVGHDGRGKDDDENFGSQNAIDAEVLRSLVEFVYRGKVEVSEEKLSSLKWSADQLGLKALVDLINTFTLNRLKRAQKTKEKSLRRRNMRRISKRKGRPVKISNDEEEAQLELDRESEKTPASSQDQSLQELSLESQVDLFSDTKMETPESRNNDIDSLVSTILLENEGLEEDENEESQENEGDDEDYVAEGESDVDWNLESETKRYKSKRGKSGVGNASRKKTKQTTDDCNNQNSESSAGKDPNNRRWRRKLIAECFDATRNVLVCKYCDKGFKDKGNFIHHVRCHENPNLLFQCTLCEHKSVGRHTLMEHMASKHHVDAKGNALERNIKCHKCSFTCFANFQLKNHVFQKHSKPFTCEKCNYSCASTAVLTRHIKAVHDNERPFMCETCGYRAKTMLVFKRHLKVHSGKKIVCDICGLSLTHQSFRGHMKLHLTDERPHPCHLCSFAARKRYSLKVHLKNVHKIDIETLVHLTKFESTDSATPSCTSSSVVMQPHIVNIYDTGQQHDIITDEMCMQPVETIHQINTFMHNTNLCDPLSHIS